MSLSSITLGGQILHGIDPAGCRWRTTADGTSGWEDGASTTRDTVQRAGADGAFPSTGHMSGRHVIIAGFTTCPDPVTAKAAQRQLVARLRGALEELAWTDAAGTLSALVELEDGQAIQVSPVNDCMFSWRVPVHAPDPLRYGAPAFGSVGLSGMTGTGRMWPRVWPLDWGVPAGATPGAVQVSNDGTAAYWPRLRVDGPVTNPVITCNETGSWVRFNGALSAGQWLDWDLANRRVLLNGQVSRREFVTSSGDWLAIPVDGGSISWSADDADPNALLSVWSYEGAWS